MTTHTDQTPHFTLANPWAAARRVAIAAMISVVGASAAASQARPAPSTAQDAGLLQRMLDAEDARATDSASLGALVAGLRSPDVTTRQIAARAIGRMERRENLTLLEPMLTDPSPFVRAEAVNAVAQIAKADGPNAWPLDRMESLLTTLVEIDRLVKQRGFEEAYL